MVDEILTRGYTATKGDLLGRPDSELVAILNMLRTERRETKPDPMEEHTRDMQLMQQIKQLQKEHNYAAARDLVTELPASDEAKKQLIDYINRKEARQNGQTAIQ